MMTRPNTNADRCPALPPDEQVRTLDPLMLGVGKALRCAYARSGRASDIGMFEPLIAALRKK